MSLGRAARWNVGVGAIRLVSSNVCNVIAMYYSCRILFCVADQPLYLRLGLFDLGPSTNEHFFPEDAPRDSERSAEVQRCLGAADAEDDGEVPYQEGPKAT